MPFLRIPLSAARAVTLSLGLALAAVPAFPQDTAQTDGSGTAAGTGTAGTVEAPPPSLGTPVDDTGKEYTAKTFDAWELRCVKTESGKDPCQLFQLLKDAQGGDVAEFSMIPLPPGQQAVAGATIVTPLETLLTEQVTLGIDSGQAKKYPFAFCTAIGCVSRVGFTADEITAFRKGVKATLTIVPLSAPDQKVALDVSLKGFTAGFEELTRITEENAKKE
ncbi:MAG: invasion associated locus B family protein [Paracoccaceae bacterium]